MNIMKLLLPHENKWVALSNDLKKVVASDTSYSKAFEKAKEVNAKKFKLLWVAPFDVSFTP